MNIGLSQQKKKKLLKRINDYMSTETHDQIIENLNVYIEENQKFSDKGNKAAATRARKALLEIKKLCGDRRKEIIEAKNAS